MGMKGSEIEKFIKDAFGNALEAQLRVIGVGKAMRFIADTLE